MRGGDAVASHGGGRWSIGSFETRATAAARCRRRTRRGSRTRAALQTPGGLQRRRRPGGRWTRLGLAARSQRRRRPGGEGLAQVPAAAEAT
jgi:hypothetical protein